jgi:hypothetical protein
MEHVHENHASPWIRGFSGPYAPARAEPVDCGLFPDMHSRFACYDNLSRAPKPDPQKTVKPELVKPKAAIARDRKTIGAD